MKKLGQKINNIYYDIKWSIWSFRKMFKVMINFRPWDYSYALNTLVYQISLLKNGIKDCSLLENQDENIKDIDRFLELHKNLSDDNYAERCGYNYDAEDFNFIPCKEEELKDYYELQITKNPGYEHVDNTKAMIEGSKLEDQEWEEMINILKHMKKWWY